MQRTIFQFVVCALTASIHLSGNASKGDKNRWTALEGLSGTWHLAVSSSAAETAFRIDMRAISRGTALVETFGDPAVSTTQTVYHRDGENILATHYCAQGNQPRLRMSSLSTPDALSFRFHDITNLKSPAASHFARQRPTAGR